MKTGQVTLCGKEYDIVFNMQTMINFEEIANKSFMGVKFDRIHDRIILIFAAVLSADAETKLKPDELLKADNMAAVREIGTAFSEVAALMDIFFEVPAVEPKPEKPADSKEDPEKN